MMKQGKFIYDLMSELRKDPERAALVADAARRVDMIAAAVAKGKASRQDVAEAEAAIIPLSGFNFGLLIPRFFPRYPFDAPLDFSSRPFMFAMTTMTPGSVITLKAGRQVGKCADGDTEVTTQSGSATLRELFERGEPVSAVSTGNS